MNYIYIILNVLEMPHLYIYVWFPLVPHWDVLSIAWKCSKYRFWVCSNYFF